MSTIIFHIITHFDLGGAETVAVNIASSKTPDSQYHLVEVVRGRGDYSNQFVEDIKSKGIRYHRSRIRNNKFGIVLFPFWFLLLFLRYRPTVIHTHTEVPDLSIYLFYRLFGWMFRKTSYVRTIHNTVLWSQWGRIGDMVEKFFQSHDSNIAISKSVQHSYAERYGEKPPIIYNGLEEVEQKPFENINHRQVNVLFAGRLEYQKGIDELIAVINGCKDNEKVDFWIVGTGSMKEKVEQCVRGNSHVHYFDKIFGLSRYLASFDYLFMPSNFEGLALMPIEASFAKVPAVINSCPGLEDTLPIDWPLKVVDNCIGQYLEIFNNISKYDHDTLGLIAYNFAKKNFSVKKMQRSYEDFYSE